MNSPWGFAPPNHNVDTARPFRKDRLAKNVPSQAEWIVRIGVRSGD
jgi:hypothetical protein